jgi:hypothetical protein
MGRSIFWTALDTIGFEYLELTTASEGVTADGLVVQQLATSVLRMQYRIVADSDWRTRQVQVDLPGSDMKLTLHADGHGRWLNSNDQQLPNLGGCLDVDLQGTPFTNMLAIRRLGLAIGDSAEIKLAYIEIPNLRLTTSRQRYTRLTSSRYQFESLEDGFKAELDVDEDGLVLTYEGLWKRATNP